MKRTWKCPKCQSERVGYLETVPDGGSSSSGSTTGDRKIGKAEAGEMFGLKAYRGAGDVEAFVCTVCGYFEEYVRAPEAIPWDTMQGFRWCKPPGT